MFDWLFGSKRQTNHGDLSTIGNAVNKNNADMAAYYNDNIANGNWDKLNIADKQRVSDTYNAMRSASEGGKSQFDAYNKAYGDEEKANRYNYFGNGLLGAILNPIGQTVSAGKDLATGQYGKNGRDAASDLGALAETALTFLPMAGGAMKAMKLGKAGAAVNGAINSIPGMALTGAGFGAADAYRQGGQNTQPLDVLGGAAMGGLFGGGIPIAGRMGSKLLRNRGANVLTNAMTNKGMDQAAIDGVLGSLPNKALYQQALQSFVPRSTFGKIAAGGGLLYGGSRLLNSGGEQQPMNYNDYSSMAQDPYAQYGMGY